MGLNNKSRIESGTIILVTGSAGFIGFHTSRALLKRGCIVIGYDNCNDYYDGLFSAKVVEPLIL